MKNCEKCGAALSDDYRVCPNCGTPVKGAQQHFSNASTYNGPMGNTTPVLVWGIMGLVFSVSFFLSFLGIVFSIIGINKYKSFQAFSNSVPSKQATIGHRLAVAGLIVGIILTVLLGFFLIAMMLTAGQR